MSEIVKKMSDERTSLLNIIRCCDEGGYMIIQTRTRNNPILETRIKGMLMNDIRNVLVDYITDLEETMKIIMEGDGE